MCASPIRPWRWAVAVAVNCGASGSPVSARRGPRSAASAMRRAASGLVMRNRLASAQHSVPPSSSSLAWVSSWLINVCPTAGSRRTKHSRRSRDRSRSGVVNTSKDTSSKRSSSASSASKTSTIRSRPALCPVAAEPGQVCDLRFRLGVRCRRRHPRGLTDIRPMGLGAARRPRP